MKLNVQLLEFFTHIKDPDGKFFSKIFLQTYEKTKDLLQLISQVHCQSKYLK